MKIYQFLWIWTAKNEVNVFNKDRERFIVNGQFDALGVRPRFSGYYH